jgi:pimeloyl-ACP methyl ester carboxylesterase
MHLTSADGVELAYSVRGAGAPALVFVHGWSCDQGYWRGQVEHFATRFKVVTVDLAGHGKSGAGRERWTIAAFGADVAAVVEALGLDRVILIGHSMGGDVILEAACRLAGGIAGLVWVDSYRQLSSFRNSEQVQRRLQPFRDDFVAATREFVRRVFPVGADPALVERVAADMAAAPPQIACSVFEAASRFGPSVPAILQQLRLPLFAINPAEPPTDLESMRRHGAAVIAMPGVGHFPMLEDPRAFNAVLMNVVTQLAGANQ